MDLRDYLTLLRRGALTIAATTALAGVLAVLYLQVTPQTYQSTASVLVAPRSAGTIGELQLGSQYATSASPTIANLMNSTAVLEPAAQSLADDGAAAGISPAALGSSFGTTRDESSSVILVTATAQTPELAAALANAVVTSASQEVPALVNDRDSGSRPFVELQVVQAAEPPAAPIAPAPRRITALFLAVGLAVGLAISLLRQSLDNRLRQTDDVVETTELPLLATLAKERRRASTPIVVRDAPHSPSVEGYRVLRTNLGALTSGSRRSVLVAAASSDSTAVRVPVNLAWSLAQAGRRVLLIDLDLRHQAIADLLGVDAPLGAAEVLTGRAELGDVISSTAMPELDVLVGGTAVEAPSDLLSGPVLATVIQRAEDAYDYVLIHAPALLSFTDAAVVARVASRAVVVVRSGHTRTPDLTSAVGVLGNVGVSPLGIVLSDAKMSVTENVRARDAKPARPTVATDGGRRIAARVRTEPASGSGGRSSAAPT